MQRTSLPPSGVGFDHFLACLRRGFVLHPGIDHHSVLVDGDHGKSQHLLGDRKASGLGRIQGAELHGLPVDFLKAVEVRNKGRAGHAPVAVKVHQNISLCIQHFLIKVFLRQIDHCRILLSDSCTALCNRDYFCLYYIIVPVYKQVLL